MRTNRGSKFLAGLAAALGAGLIAFSASAVAAPPVVPTCTPEQSSGSDSCVRGTVDALDGGIGSTLEPVRVGVRTRSVFDPATSETTNVTLRFDDDIAINLAGLPSCPSSELTGRNISAAYEQCGPGADGNPPSEGNAFLSAAGNVSGIGSTVPPANLIACTMIFKGANNNQITLYARAPVASATTGCNNPATNTGARRRSCSRASCRTSPRRRTTTGRSTSATPTPRIPTWTTSTRPSHAETLSGHDARIRPTGTGRWGSSITPRPAIRPTQSTRRTPARSRRSRSAGARQQGRSGPTQRSPRRRSTTGATRRSSSSRPPAPPRRASSAS